MDEKKMDGRNILLGLLVLGLVVVAIVLSAGYSSQGSQNVLTVTGSSQLFVMPDKAELYLSVQNTEPTAKDAQAKTTDATNKVTAALVAMGVQGADIETSSYMILPKEVYDEKTGEYKLQGYTATHTLKVTTTDIGNTGKYVDAAVAAGTNMVDHIDFSLSTEKEKQVKTQLLGMASSSARDKATALATGMGIRLGKVASITETNYNVGPINYDLKTQAPSAATIIPPQLIDSTAYVTVSYRI